MQHTVKQQITICFSEIDEGDQYYQRLNDKIIRVRVEEF